MNDLIIREISLYLKDEREALICFLKSFELSYENDIDYALGLYSNDTLCGCGCASGGLLKCFAVSDSLRGQNGLGLLVSRLMANCYSKGIFDLHVITRAHNIPLFEGCGFSLVAATKSIALLENPGTGLKQYLNTLPQAPDTAGRIGAIVMNGNPPTNGHLALIQYAASRSDYMYIFVVEEDRSVFSFQDRLSLIREIAAPYPHAHVCSGGHYMISSATFPTYFMKETESPSVLQSDLDITIFASCIAPALRITTRFAGEEPFDPVTAAYNGSMRRILPTRGIAFCEIPRACRAGVPISATQIRILIQALASDKLPADTYNDHVRTLSALLPPPTLRLVLSIINA